MTTSQLALFPASGLVHVPTYTETTRRFMIKAPGGDIPGSHVWFGWTCSCGETSPGQCWSHVELAARMWELHATGGAT